MTKRPSAALTILSGCALHAAEIATITRDAFRARYGTGDSEVEILTGLRRDGDVVVELAALENGEIVGHAMFSRMIVDPPLCRVAALGPVCARVGSQNGGVGATLIRAGIAACLDEDIAAVFVLGDPAYYGRFGFGVETAAQVGCSHAGPHLQALELRSGALAGVKSVAYAPAFAAV